jgi:hypothetical protein
MQPAVYRVRVDLPNIARRVHHQHHHGMLGMLGMLGILNLVDIPPIYRYIQYMTGDDQLRVKRHSMQDVLLYLIRFYTSISLHSYNLHAENFW